MSPEGSVSTVAGGAGCAREGYADGTGADALFSHPSSITIDANGIAVVADVGNNRLRLVDLATGSVTTLAGRKGGFVDGLAVAAQFSGPEGVAIDRSGNAVVCDSGNHRLRVITAGLAPPDAPDLGQPPLRVLAQDLRGMLASGTLADVTFVLDSGAEIKAHSQILAARNEPLATMLTSASTSEAADGRVRLVDVSEVGLNGLLRFFYAASTELPDDAVFEVLPLAHQYRADALVDVCAKRLVAMLAPGNAIASLLLCDLHQIDSSSVQRARALTVKYVAENFMCLDDAEVQQLDPRLLVEIIRLKCDA